MERKVTLNKNENTVNSDPLYKIKGVIQTNKRNRL